MFLEVKLPSTWTLSFDDLEYLNCFRNYLWTAMISSKDDNVVRCHVELW